MRNASILGGALVVATAITIAAQGPGGQGPGGPPPFGPGGFGRGGAGRHDDLLVAIDLGRDRWIVSRYPMGVWGTTGFTAWSGSALEDTKPRDLRRRDHGHAAEKRPPGPARSQEISREIEPDPAVPDHTVFSRSCIWAISRTFLSSR